MLGLALPEFLSCMIRIRARQPVHGRDNNKERTTAPGPSSFGNKNCGGGPGARLLVGLGEYAQKLTNYAILLCLQL